MCKAEYKEIDETAMEMLIPFGRSYLCVTGSSAVATIKRKYRSHINVEQEWLFQK
jgi:hypothetical protein